MSESSITAFGLRIVVVTDDAAFDVVPVIFGVLPAAPSDGTAPHITLRIHRGPVPAAPSTAASFFHGTVEGRVVDDGFALSTSVTEARVSADGGLIDVVVHGEPGDEAELRLGVPVFIAMAIALRHHGRFHLHAAGLEDEGGRSILIAGQQGAGKTSTCLALVEAGAAFVGDDAVFLAEREGVVVAHGVPKAFHLAERTQAAFPHLRALCGVPAPGTLGPSGPAKRPLDARRAWQGRLRTHLAAPFTIVFPEITGAPTTSIEPVDDAEAFGLLLESSALGIVDGMTALPAQLALLQRIAADGRSWRLRLGADALERPSLVAALLRPGSDYREK